MKWKWEQVMFQSLSRDSGRLNLGPDGKGAEHGKVSIPQSGFGAFELEWMAVRCSLCNERFQSLSRDSGRLNRLLREALNENPTCFNPSVGIRGV